MIAGVAAAGGGLSLVGTAAVIVTCGTAAGGGLANVGTAFIIIARVVTIALGFAEVGAAAVVIARGAATGFGACYMASSRAVEYISRYRGEKGYRKQKEYGKTMVHHVKNGGCSYSYTPKILGLQVKILANNYFLC